MRSLSFFLLNFSFILICNGQTSVKSADKPPLDFSILGKWPYVEYPKISNDGKYALYTYKESDKERLIIKATEGKWEKQVTGASSMQAVFTEDSRHIVSRKADTLFVINPSESKENIIANVASYKTPLEGNGEWLAYLLKNDSKELVLRSLKSGKENRFAFVGEYMFSKNGSALLLKTQVSKGSFDVQVFYPGTGKLVSIWQGKQSGNYCFDASGDQLAFIAADPGNDKANALWLYRPGMEKAMVLADSKTKGIEKDLRISNNQVRFNKDGSKVFFYLEPPELPKPKPGYVSVDVWSYSDAKLQSQQLQEINIKKKYLAVTSLSANGIRNKVIRLEFDGDKTQTSVQENKADFIIMYNSTGEAGESNWNNAAFTSVYLVSTRDGSRKLVKADIPSSGPIYVISPEEKFVISYDGEKRCFFSYEITTGIIRNISKDLPVPTNNEEAEYPKCYSVPYSVTLTWLNKDKAVLVYDQYDIWQIDPLGLKQAINLTKGYGRIHKIVFRLVQNGGVLHFLTKDNKIPLIAFNKKNKENGFYSIRLNQLKHPEVLNMGSYVYYVPGAEIENNFPPLRAKHQDVYLISKRNSAEPPNLFFTKDFQVYTSLSNVPSPLETNNWFNATLIEWKTFDSSQSQGILYRPNNFDSTKKYPIIFFYYEQKSDKLNEFLYPKFTEGDLDIPYFVSNGYLVFTPDIHYKIGYPGESAYNSVVSAARYLSQYKWVDSTKMGITGHSFGGYETNYLITRTNMFAAAVSAAGVANFISGYGGLRGSGEGMQGIYEVSQSRVGPTLWQNSEFYISNSPVFRSDKVTTPLLLMNNKDDSAVPFFQGVEFFTALRRLGKRVWMLQYDEGGHSVGGKEAKDFTLRVKQFFDHYLKGVPAPRWMTRGIPAKMKGIEDGFEVDPTITTPREGLIK